MNAISLSASPRPRGLAGRIRDVAVLTGRNLVHIAREPLQLSDVTVQPVLFTLLFVYVFGAGIVAAGRRQLHRLRDRRPAGAEPHDLLDGDGGRAQHRPLDRRHRPLPDAPDVASGRARRPLARRPHDGGDLRHDRVRDRSRDRLAARGRRPLGARRLGVFLLFSYALSWACACLGILSKGPESAQGVGLVMLFPLAFVSNALVPTQHMPTVLRTIADWNPVSAVTAAARSCSATRTRRPRSTPGRCSTRGRDARLVVRAARDLRAARERPLPPPHQRVIARFVTKV